MIEAPELLVSSGAAVKILRSDLPGFLSSEPVANKISAVAAGQAADSDSGANESAGSGVSRHLMASGLGTVWRCARRREAVRTKGSSA